MDILVWILAVLDCLILIRIGAWKAIMFLGSFTIVFKSICIFIGFNISSISIFALASTFMISSVILALKIEIRRELELEQNYQVAASYFRPSVSNKIQTKVPQNCKSCAYFNIYTEPHCAVHPYLQVNCSDFEQIQ